MRISGGRVTCGKVCDNTNAMKMYGAMLAARVDTSQAAP